MIPISRSAPHAAFAVAAALALAACGDGDQTQAGDRLDGAAAPTYPGEGAAGLVEAPGEAMENAADATLDGGPAGQTPDYGEAAGVPSEARSDASSQPSHAESQPQ